MCWWCQPQLHTDAGGTFIKDDMTHLLCPANITPSLASLPAKIEVLQFQKGVHSCYISNANREPRNTSLLLFDANNTATHKWPHSLVFLFFPTRTGGIFSLLLIYSLCFLSVLACYLLEELSASASLTEGWSNLWGESGSPQEIIDRTIQLLQKVSSLYSLAAKELGIKTLRID